MGERTEIRAPLGSDFKIAEVGGSKREIILSGRGLPYRPIGFGGEAIIKKQHHQGNPETTIQVLGTKESSTAISGQWKADLLDGTQGKISLKNMSKTSKFNNGITPILEYIEAIDTMRAGAPLVTVTWMGQSRTGVMTGFSYKYHHALHAEWEMNFEWESFQVKAGKSALIANPPGGIVKEPSLEKLVDAMDFAERWLSGDPTLAAMGQPTNPVKDFVSDFQDVIGRIKGLMGKLSNLSKLSASFIRSPIQATRETIETLVSIKDDIITGIHVWENEYTQEIEAWDNLETADWASPYDIRKNLREVAAEIEILKRESIANALTLGVSPKEDTLMVKDIVVGSRSSQHLGEICKHQYGDYRLWPRLAVFNGIDGLDPIIGPGMIIIIPFISSLPDANM